MPVVPPSALPQEKSALEKPSPTNLLMAAADMVERARSMPGPQTAEPDLKATRKRKMKVLK